MSPWVGYRRPQPDDVNTLAFGKSTEANCRTLQTIHEWCLEWARLHGALLAPEKYIFVHFTKARTKHNSASPLILPTSTIHPSPSARVLGVILDKKLSWQPHRQHIKSRWPPRPTSSQGSRPQHGAPPYRF